MKQTLFLLCMLTTGLSAQTTTDDHIRARSSFRIGATNSTAARGITNRVVTNPAADTLVTSRGVYNWVTGLTFGGDVSGLYNSLTLANSGVTAGTCTNCSLTIDAKGRVTVKGSGSAGATYTAGSGIAIGGGNEISNTAPNVVQVLGLASNTLSLTNGGGSVDLSPYLNAAAQTLSYSAPNLSISGGNSVDISGNNYWSKATNDLYYTAGNVGIGTASPTSKLDITTSALGATQTNAAGLALINTTAATNGAQQISPPVLWEGQGYGTTGSAAQITRFRADVLPVQGTTAPTATWQLGASIAAGAYTNRMTVGSDGAFFAGVSTGSSITANTTVGMQMGGGANGVFRIRTVSGGYTTFFTVGQNYDWLSQPGTWQFKNENSSFGNNATTGTGAHVLMAETFKPASGTAVYSELTLSPTINQTGGANGITRGLYINPTITAAADFKGLELAQNTQTALLQSGASATNRLAGQTTIGATTTPATSAALDITSTTGALLLPRMTSAQRDALTAANGMVIYNTTTDKVQARAAGAWVDLH